MIQKMIKKFKKDYREAKDNDELGNFIGLRLFVCGMVGLSLVILGGAFYIHWLLGTVVFFGGMILIGAHGVSDH